MTLKSLFSFQGRFSRSQFWLWGFGLPALVGLLCVGLISALMLPSSDSDGVVGIFIVIGILYLPLTFVGIAGSVKRLHDLGRSGWWYLLTLIPLINVGFVIWIGAFRGSNGQNQFGGDPLQGTTKKVEPRQLGWVLVGVTGQYQGCVFPLNEVIVIGTDPKKCSVIIDAETYTDIKPMHCKLNPNDITRDFPALYMLGKIYTSDGHTDRDEDIHRFLMHDYYKSRLLKLSPHLSFEVRAAT